MNAKQVKNYIRNENGIFVKSRAKLVKEADFGGLVQQMNSKYENVIEFNAVTPREGDTVNYYTALASQNYGIHEKNRN